MTIRRPWRLPSLNAFPHDARQLILAYGIISGSFLGAFSLLRNLYMLRLGLTPAYIGAYHGIGSFYFMALGMPCGALGQRFGTRKVMIIGAWLAAFGMALLPVGQMVAPTLRTVIPFVSQFVLTTGWATFSINAVPALMTATQASNRSGAYAMLSAFQGVGSLVGTLAGGALPGLVAQIAGRSAADPFPFAWALVLASMLGLPVIRPLVRIRGGLLLPPDSRAAVQRGSFPFLPVVAIAIYVILRHAGWTTCAVFCSPYMDTELGLTAATIGLVTSVGQVAAILAVFAIPRLAGRWSHGWIVVMSTAVLALSLLLLALVPHWGAVAVGLLGVQVAAALWLPALQVFQMELVPEGWRAIAYGALTTAMGSGYGVTSLFGGWFVDSHGYRALFRLGAVFSAVGALMMAAISRIRTRI